jgi:hypothetical protein
MADQVAGQVAIDDQVAVGQGRALNEHPVVRQGGGVNEPVPPAVWGVADMNAAIAEAVRDALEDDELTDEDIVDGTRISDKYNVLGPDGTPVFEFEVGLPYPNLTDSRVVGIFTFPTEDSVPGDVRIYVALPMLPVAGVRDHLCYVFNRATMTTRREKMTRDLFVEEVAGELARLFDLGDTDDDEEEEEEPDEEIEDDGVACADEACSVDPTFACVCQSCAAVPAEARFYACAEHRGSANVAQAHVEEMSRPPKWQKTTLLAAVPLPEPS